MKDNIITGLDIGSSMIRVVVGQKIEQEPVHIIGVAEIPSEGISRGVINSIEDAVSSIATAFEKAERMTGVPSKSAYVSIAGTHILSQSSRGVVAVAKADGEIREQDVDRAIEAAQAVATPPNYEILHVIPRSFTVDSQSGIKDPVGMTGIRLEVEAQIIQGLSAQVKNITKSVYRTGVDIDDVVLAPLAAAEASLNKRQKELGVCLVNIGGSTTSIAVFEEGDVLHTSILPVGSTHITSDIAIGLRTSLETAELVKVRYGTALPDDIDKKEEIDLSEFGDSEEEVVSRRHVADIIQARVEEIFQMADGELKGIERSGKLPAGIVITGGGAKLEGLGDIARKEFRLPASIGYPKEVSSAIDKVHDPTLSTAVGLVLWGDHLQQEGGAGMLSRFSSVHHGVGKMRSWFQSLGT